MNGFVIRIEQGVPIPPPGVNWLVGMNVGDSIAVAYSYRHRLSGRIRYHQKTRGPDQKFTRRTMMDASGEKYVRVWRVV